MGDFNTVTKKGDRWSLGGCQDRDGKGEQDEGVSLIEKPFGIYEMTQDNPTYQAFTEEVITRWTSTRTKQEILDLIGGRVPCGPANTMEEVFADPHIAARAMIEQYQLPGENPAVALSGNPIKFTKSQTSFYQGPPRLGEHSGEILAEFGITPVD